MPRKVTFSDVSKAFSGKPVLARFTAEFAAGTPTMLLGPSGRGKTTVLRLAAGLIKPDAGTVSGNDAPMGYVFQEDRLIERMSARQNVAFVCKTANQTRDIPVLLERLGLGDAGDTPVAAFSGGMKRRVAIARALVTRPALLLLDEPYTGLDDAAKAVAAALIREYMTDAVVLFVTHDPREARLTGVERALTLDQ